MTREQFLAQNQSERDKPVTTGILLDTLLTYTDEFLIPAMSHVMDEKLDLRLKESEARMGQKMAAMEHNLKAYIDAKLADYTSDIFKRLEARYQKDRAFKEKIVDLFKKNHFGSPEDIAFLEGMVRGS